MPYIEWAVKNGIVQGDGDNNFAPASSVTREQMAVMMANYAKATNYTLPVSRQAVTFADNAEIGSWAADAMKAIQQTGVIVGKQGNVYDPQGSAARPMLRPYCTTLPSGKWYCLNAGGKLAVNTAMERLRDWRGRCEEVVRERRLYHQDHQDSRHSDVQIRDGRERA
jgi:hypothetical protein